jgi:intein/homing endonuclease
MKREALADVGVWCCHPDVTIIVDDAPITIKELYDSSVNGIVDKECLSFNPKNKCFEIDIIEEVLRRPFSGDMYEFYLESGEILRVTGDHIIFIEREGKLLEVRAKDLIETDELISIE